ncbi:MAG: endonuclease/exonuclease/phosphatase family protein [Actinomycetota bacterium]
MRIVTWNLWWRFGPWEARQPAIAAELASLEPDVALLQEVWATEDGADQAAILGDRLGMHVARTVDGAGRPQAFGNAILSRWPILDQEMVVLPDAEGNPSHRSALTAILDTPNGPQPFTVTHLAWQYDASVLRQAQLEAVVDLVIRHRSDDPEVDPPPVLAGDFNAVPDSDEIRRLTGRSAPVRPGLIFTDCWEAVGSGVGHTWTRDNPHSAAALWPRRRLDYVFVAWPRPKPLANPLSARLAGTRPHDGPDGPMVPSDHAAVVVELYDRQT